MYVILEYRAPVLCAWCLLLTVSYAVSGCDLFGADEEDVSAELQTDQTLYVTRSAIALEITNHGEAPIYRAGCPVITLQELRDDALLNEWIVAGFKYCGGYFAIEARGSYRDTLSLGSELLEERLSTARFNEAVDYRLNFVSLYRSKESSDRLSRANRQSNHFKITQP